MINDLHKKRNLLNEVIIEVTQAYCLKIYYNFQGRLQLSKKELNWSQRYYLYIITYILDTVIIEIRLSIFSDLKKHLFVQTFGTLLFLIFIEILIYDLQISFSHEARYRAMDIIIFDNC